MQIMLGHAMPPAATRRVEAGVSGASPSLAEEPVRPAHTIWPGDAFSDGKPDPLAQLGVQSSLLSRGCPLTPGQPLPTLGAGVPPPSRAPRLARRRRACPRRERR